MGWRVQKIKITAGILFFNPIFVFFIPIRIDLKLNTSAINEAIILIFSVNLPLTFGIYHQVTSGIRSEELV